MKLNQKILNKWSPILDEASLTGPRIELPPETKARQVTSVVLGPTDMSQCDFTKHTMEQIVADFQKSWETNELYNINKAR